MADFRCMWTLNSPDLGGLCLSRDVWSRSGSVEGISPHFHWVLNFWLMTVLHGDITVQERITMHLGIIFFLHTYILGILLEPQRSREPAVRSGRVLSVTLFNTVYDRRHRWTVRRAAWRSRNKSSDLGVNPPWDCCALEESLRGRGVGEDVFSLRWLQQLQPPPQAPPVAATVVMSSFTASSVWQVASLRAFSFVFLPLYLDLWNHIENDEGGSWVGW